MKKGRFWKRKIVFRAITIAVITIFVAFSDNLDAAADTVNSPRIPEVVIMKSDLDSIIISINLYGLEEEEIEINSQMFQILTIPGYGYTSEVGTSQIPVIRKIIGIPDNAVVTANVLHASYSTQSGYMVYPLQSLEVDEDSDFVINETFYLQDVFYPKELVELGKPGIWRDISVVTLQVSPVMFNPANNELRVYDRIIVELQYSSGVSDEKTIYPMFAHMYESTILNYEYLNVRETINSDGYKYIAITHPCFVDEIQPLIDWLNSTGLKAFLVDTNVTGENASDIKNYITSFYQSNPSLEYVLLVGDIVYVPWYEGWGVTGSDYWYGCISAQDLYPELAVGRISASTQKAVTRQVNKILQYEKHPAPGDWVEKALLIAHKEGAPGKYEGCKEEIRTATYADPFIFDTAYGSTGATNCDVNKKINTGRGVVDYRGHGSTNSWSGWTTATFSSYCTLAAHLLANGDKTPVIFSIACLNAQLSDSKETLAEAFMTGNQGAVAFLGASDPSYTIANHDFDKWLFDAICNQNIYRIGWVSNYANVKLIEKYGEGHTYMDNVKMYLWLGDPALEVWTSQPMAMDVIYPNEVLSGEKMTVTVRNNTIPLKNALVCMQTAGCYVTGVTGDDGMVTLSIPFPSTKGTVDVTLTKHNYLPWHGTVKIKNAMDNYRSIDEVGDKKTTKSLLFRIDKAASYTTLKNVVDIYASLMEYNTTFKE